MAIEQDFLPYAVGGSANVLSQSAYAALTTLLQNGLTSGIVPSNELNKIMRQSSIMAAVLAQFIVDNSGQPAIDDGTTATLEANLVAAIRSATKTGVILADTGAANAYTAVNVPPLVAGTWVDGTIQQVKIAHANTGTSTYAPDGLTAIPIYGLGLTPLQGGELALNGTAILMRATIAGVNSGNPIAVLMECAGGAQQIAPATAPNHAVQLGQMLANISRYTSSGTFTAPFAGTYYLSGCAGGGGGGGGGSNNSAGTAGATAGGGGAGQPAIRVPVTLTAGQVVTVTVGAAGSAGTAPGQGVTPGGTGGNGGNTIFVGLLTLTGGTGGSGAGQGSSGSIVSGASGGAGYPGGGSGTDGSMGGAANGWVGVGGAGGSGPFGGGGPGGRSGAGSGISAGSAYGFGAGGGGGGACYSVGGSGGAGTAGMPGFAMIEW